MTILSGKHYIAGQWVKSETTFQADNPTSNQKNPTVFCNATPELVDDAVNAAQQAFKVYASTSLSARAVFLNTIADEIEARGDAITRIAGVETALPAARLEMERGRTVNQLRFFASWIEEGTWLGARIDQADPERAPLPKPDIRVVNQALGPVAVFGASNFPLAFSTAGGDTASALAAGCPVIVKAHSAHPGTCEIVAQAIGAAVEKCDMPAGVFSQLQGGNRSVGSSLVAHPGIKAVGFTGSLGGGRALYDIAVSRPEPIPFYGELGSNNPVFLLPEVMAEKAAFLGEAWAQSLTMGVGQFCTNPGVVVTLVGEATESFKSAATSALKDTPPQPMLTSRIADAYHDITNQHSANNQLTCLMQPQESENSFCATPGVYVCSAQVWLENEGLSEEIFGPCAIVVECRSFEEMKLVAAAFCGQLTATLHMNKADTKLASILTPMLGEKAGRVLVNGFPTGVEVCHSMIHGGPYPASTNSQTTSVGTLAIGRFVRPVSYQGAPNSILPEALKNENPLGIRRLVDGVWRTEAL